MVVLGFWGEFPGLRRGEGDPEKLRREKMLGFWDVDVGGILWSHRRSRKKLLGVFWVLGAISRPVSRPVPDRIRANPLSLRINANCESKPHARQSLAG